MFDDPANIGLVLHQDRQAFATQATVGFKFGEKGTHTSRTMMLEELSMLLRVCEPKASRAICREAIIHHNCLGKRTASTRKLSDQRLGELYGLDPSILLFRVMRHLWQMDERGQPLMALLVAMARDPLLRATAPSIMRLLPGEELGRQQFINALSKSVGSRLNESILDKVVRNTASSWTQSGHLDGRNRKIRRTVHPTPSVVVLALLHGYILGAKGSALFNTLWAKVLDAQTEELMNLAMDAKRIGLISMKQAGGVVEVSFGHLLTEEERRQINGSN